MLATKSMTRESVNEYLARRDEARVSKVFCPCWSKDEVRMSEKEWKEEVNES